MARSRLRSELVRSRLRPGLARLLTEPEAVGIGDAEDDQYTVTVLELLALLHGLQEDELALLLLQADCHPVPLLPLLWPLAHLLLGSRGVLRWGTTHKSINEGLFSTGLPRLVSKVQPTYGTP